MTNVAHERCECQVERTLHCNLYIAIAIKRYIAEFPYSEFDSTSMRITAQLKSLYRNRHKNV